MLTIRGPALEASLHNEASSSDPPARNGAASRSRARAALRCIALRAWADGFGPSGRRGAWANQTSIANMRTLQQTLFVDITILRGRHSIVLWRFCSPVPSWVGFKTLEEIGRMDDPAEISIDPQAFASKWAVVIRDHERC